MQRARSFFYVSAGVFLLALAYHFGASTATAQAPGNPVVAMTSGYNAVLAANGDVYTTSSGTLSGPWVRVANVFTGGPTAAAQPTFGQLKAQYRK